MGEAKTSAAALFAERVMFTDEEFDLVVRLVGDRFGIQLNASKKSLVEARLQSVIRERSYRSFREYYDAELVRPTSESLSLLVDRLTTNYTYFYREEAHFRQFADVVLPEWKRRLLARGQRDLRVWCAAASTGEEPYTLAMLIRDFLGPEILSWQAGLLATDISAQALAKARAGVYADEALEKLPAQLRRRYFVPERPGCSRVSDDLRRDVTYRRLNLNRGSFPFRNPFQVIFCRNVMIYFDAEVKRRLVEELWRHLEPGGYLFVGHSEGLSERGRFQHVAPAVYRRAVA